MPFILNTNPPQSFPYTAKIPVITETGRVKQDPLELKFKRLSRSEIAAIQQANTEAKDGLQTDLDFILQVADGWNVAAPDGSTVPFTEENVRQLIDLYPTAAGAIVDAFFEATLRGGEKRKN